MVIISSGGNIVFGIDSDFSGTTLSETQAGNTISLLTLSTNRARIGYAFDNILPYVTGGLATSLQSFDPNIVAFDTERDLTFGWTVGGGVEVGFTDNIRGRVQYNLINLQDGEFQFPGVGLTSEFQNIHVIRAGVSIKTRAIIDAVRGR